MADIEIEVYEDEVIVVEIGEGTVPPLWGTITGSLADQADLQNALDAKADDAAVTAALAEKADSDDVAESFQLVSAALNEKADTSDVAAALALKADSSAVYTKQETDSALAAKADSSAVYTKQETDTALAAKADSSAVYTKQETDTALAAKADTSDVAAALAEKADADDVYTKQETDTALAAKADSSAVYTKQETDTALASKADSTAVYTKQETDTALAAKADSTAVYSKQETDTALAAKADTSDVAAALAEKADADDIYTKQETDTALAAKADSTAVYTKQETDTALAAKADSSAVYTKQETDTALAEKQDNLTFDTVPTASSGNPVTSGGIKTALDEKADSSDVDAEIDRIDLALTDLSDEIEEIINQSKYKKYGVTGIGQSGAALTRTMDAVGMVAQVGTDGDNSGVVNDFDTALPWMRRKCVGEWSLEDGDAIFTVNAYYGDNDYTEDGSMGDYVAVECPRCYYHRDIFGITITSYPYPYFRPFDIFCRDHNPADTMEKIYLPAYALALKNGQAVSLPGLENEQGFYKSLLDDARTYKNGALGNLSILQPFEVNFYEWALFTVEFATQDCQSIMRGMADERSDANTRCVFLDGTHLLVTDWAQAAQTSIAGWSANWRKPGDYLCVLDTSVSDIHHMNYKATHRVISVTRCDASGAASSSGQYSLIEVEDLGKSYWSYDYTGATEYKLSGRPYPTGACNDVSTPSGSPRSNSDGHNPMKYRWRENVYGNQYKTVVNLFNARVGTSNDDYYLEWYYLPDPSKYSPSANDRPNASELNASPFIKLDLQTEHANYVNGYIRSKKYSEQNPDVWIPFFTSGGSGTTYFCDYASLVYSSAVRAVRLGGNWSNGASAGFSIFNGNSAPSTGFAYFGGDLCFIQKRG